MTQRNQHDHWNDLLHVTRSWRLEWRLDQLLSRVVKEAVGFLHLQRGAIYLLEKDGVRLHAHWPDEVLKKIIGAESQQVAEQVVRKGRSIFAHVLSGTKGGRKGAVRRRASRDVYCVPLTASRGILGALYVDAGATQQGLSQQGQEFLEMLGLQAAVAIEHGLLYQSAITDPLTGLFSHRHFQQELEQAVRRAQRSAQSLSLIMLDLDKFKQLNDTHGHEVGNSCLQQLAKLLRATLRSSDVIARFGGDEFEILLPDTNGAQAALVAEKIRTGIGKLELPAGSKVGGTLGVAEFPANASNAQALFLCADAALYEAKEAGRDRVVRSRAKAKSHVSAHDRRESEPGIVIEPPPLPSTDNLPEIRATPAGEAIDGHELIQRIGVGSSGEVLLVRQPELGREVALKRPLTPHLTGDQRKNFEREARVTASLSHPGVITVHTMGTDADGRRYYTMKPMHGMSLADTLDARLKDETARQKYSTPVVMEILQRVAEAIAYAHTQGVAHLDLTPQNIMVGQFGEVTVIDWGSSGRSSESKKDAARKRHAGLKYLSGSAAFAAPEHLQADTVPGPPADVHAMGAILYMILTGRSPYRRGNTLETLESILHTEVPRPESIAPREEIDPALSNLCMSALQRDPRRRPTSRAFAERLGRFVRKEPEWIVTQFDGTLEESEWLHNGDWTLARNVWSKKRGGPSAVLWKTSVPGGFEFECECWADITAEMALVARSGLGSSFPGSGYQFKLGAEWNTCTLLQHQYGQQALVGLGVEAGHRYRLAIHYQNRWVTCYVDGRKVLEEREIFHAPGMHLGIASWGSGTHFRPLSVRRQSWTLNISVFQMADQFLHANQFEHAHRIYSELAAVLGDRIEGLESRFKAGICMIRLNNLPEAKRIFDTLRGTMMEPFALAELGSYYFRRATLQDTRRALPLLRRVVNDFPKSPGKNYGEYVATIFTQPSWIQNLTQRLELTAEMKGNALANTDPPTMRLIHYAVDRFLSLASLGRWEQAWEECEAFHARLIPVQRKHFMLEPCRHMLALATGRGDELLNAYELGNWSSWNHENYTGFVPHCVIRRGEAGDFLRRFNAGERRDSHFPGFIPQAYLFVLLSQGGKLEVLRALDRIQSSREPIGPEILAQAYTVADALDEALLEAWIASVAGIQKDETAFRQVVPAARARLWLERGNWDEAARFMREELAIAAGPSFMKQQLLLRIVVGSVADIGQTRRELLRDANTHLAGAARDLAQMCLKEKAPVPGKLWPHPGYMPELRLWLALWLEAHGKRAQAREVASPAIDTRYGQAHCQPALRGLMERTGPPVVGNARSRSGARARITSK